MANVKFSDFTAGAEVQVGDIVVGLRAGDNYQFSFPSDGIKDVNGAYLFKYASPGVGAVNYTVLTSSISGQPSTITAAGSDANIGLTIAPKGTGDLILDLLKWPQADGSAGQVLGTDAAGQLSFVDVVNFSGPATDNAITRFDGVSGEIQDSGVIIDDADNITGVLTLDIGTSTVITGMIDDDTFATASSSLAASSESIKAYVDNGRSNKNIIIGGNFSTNPWQRGTTFTSAASSTFYADRFKWAQAGTGVVDIIKTTDSPTAAQSGIYSTSCFEIDVTTADAAMAAADTYYIDYRVEGYDFAQLIDRAATLSFWVKTTVTGVYTVGISNNVDAAYVAEYTVNSSDTWEKITLTFTPPASFLQNSTNGVGARMYFNIASGSNYNASPVLDWTNSNSLYSSSNQVNGMSSASNTFRIALVQLEAGSAATPFEIRSVSEELALCQRYFSKSYPQGVAPATVTSSGPASYFTFLTGVGNTGMQIQYPVDMRTTATRTYYNPAGAGTTWYNYTTAANSGASFDTLAGTNSISARNVGVAGDNAKDLIAIHWTATAEL